MKEALEQKLMEYKFKAIQTEANCIALMQVGKEWEEEAKKGAGIKLMIDHIEEELKKY